MMDCVKLASKVCALLADEGAESNEQCAALVTALAMVVTAPKRSDVTTAELREKCVKHLRGAIDLMHTAREALQPHG
jgi:hypothetical protein